MSAITTSKTVRKYLGTHAEASARLGTAINKEFAQVVVIPAYGEGRALDRVVASVPRVDGERILAVVVINEREDSPQSVSVINQATLARLEKQYGRHRRLSDDAQSCQTSFGELVMLSVTLPRGQGVGLARKHGADFACGAWAAGMLKSPWIHCTDADVLLPNDYFCPPTMSAVAALHPFRHEATEGVAKDYVRHYDLWLRLHVLGLHWAGSPYGFHTIGSTIAVNAYSYAAARGFPRRNAAEDFYLLNKLSKLGSIVTAPSAPVRIAARVSNRVPFGTGRAIGRMKQKGQGALPRFYAPEVYVYLKTLLQVMDRGAESAVFESGSVRQLLREQGLETAPMDAAMEALGLQAAVDRLLQSSVDGHRRRRAVHGWFDAFRTMKLIHHLRDNGIACVDLMTAVDAGDFLLRQPEIAVRDDIRVVRSHLREISLCAGDARLHVS